MDLISALSSQLGIPADQAQAVAGGALKLLKGQLGDDASHLDSAIPELGGWEATAHSVAGEGGLAGMLGGLLGGNAGEAAGLVAILAKVGLDADKAQMVAPLILEFVKSRVSPDILAKIEAVLPLLAGGGGGLAGALGSLGGLFK